MQNILQLNYKVDTQGLLDKIADGALVLWKTPGVFPLQGLPDKLVLMVTSATDIEGVRVPVVVVSDEVDAFIMPVYTNQVEEIVAPSYTDYADVPANVVYANFVAGVAEQSGGSLNPAVAMNAVYQWNAAKIAVPTDGEGQQGLADWMRRIRLQFARAMYVLKNVELCERTILDWSVVAANDPSLA